MISISTEIDVLGIDISKAKFDVALLRGQEKIKSQVFTNDLEGFTELQYGIQKEKNAMTKIWKEREKQLEKVLLNTTNFYGSVKGIAGNAIGDIKLLELGGDTEE